MAFAFGHLSANAAESLSHSLQMFDGKAYFAQAMVAGPQ